MDKSFEIVQRKSDWTFRRHCRDSGDAIDAYVRKFEPFFASPLAKGMAKSSCCSLSVSLEVVAKFVLELLTVVLASSYNKNSLKKL